MGLFPQPHSGLACILEALMLPDQLFTAVIILLDRCRCPTTVQYSSPVHSKPPSPCASLVKDFISETFAHIFLQRILVGGSSPKALLVFVSLALSGELLSLCPHSQFSASLWSYVTGSFPFSISRPQQNAEHLLNPGPVLMWIRKRVKPFVLNANPEWRHPGLRRLPPTLS